MTRGFAQKTIVLGILLLAGTSLLAAEQKGPAESVKPAPKESAPAGAKEDVKKGGKPAGETKAKAEGKEQAVVAESPTITMKVPLFSPEFAKMPIAVANDEIIPIEEFAGAIAAAHEGKAEQKTPARKNYSEVLNRLINIKLIAQEARNIGLDQLPDTKNLVGTFEKTTLRDLLFREQLKDVKADENEVEKIYRERVKEWKIASVRFTKEDDAKKMEQDLKAGKNFDDLLEKAVKEKLAEGSKEAFYQLARKLQPQVAEALAGMKVGSLSPVIRLESGFTIIRLEDVRFPEDPEAREQARRDVLTKARQKELDKYKNKLFKKYVKINTAFLKKLDFEAPKPGFKNLLKDKRAVAAITGEKPVTVADLAAAVQEKFFHGVDLAIKEKKVNEAKNDLLNQLLQKRVIIKEALAKGIDKSDEYRDRVRDYKESVTFGVFIENVARPEVKVTEDEIKTYYRDHLKEYTYPGMIRINGLAFSTMEGAQASADKLRQGVDFKWLKETTEGQLAKDTPNLMLFEGNLVATTNLPEDLRKILTGVRSGELRLYADGAGHYYSLQIQEFVPPREMPYVEAREPVARKLYDENLKKVIAEWTKKLREASDIKVYADFGDIR